MSHFLVASLDDEPLTLGPKASHHAVRVLRMRSGDAISATDGRGGLTRGAVEDADPSGLTIKVADRTGIERPSPRITVAFALTKGGKPELVVEKLTELGVDRIIPWAAARSVVRWDAAKRQANGDRLRGVAIGALEQSKRLWLPEVLDPLGSLDELLAVIDGDDLVVCDAAGAPVAAVATPTTFLIGPEGGFDEPERERFTGATHASLSDAILRAETAAIVAAALAVRHRLDRR